MIIRSKILFSNGNPFFSPDQTTSLEDGALVINATGHIDWTGDFQKLHEHTSSTDILAEANSLAIPGMVDLHTHFPQVFAAASSERELISWLNRHVFPAEAILKSENKADIAAEFYVKNLLASGTTTACVYGSQFLNANKRLFMWAENLGLDIFCGMTLMDRFTPKDLLLPFNTICDDNQALFDFSLSLKRITYTITPRFAVSCTPDLMAYSGSFAKKNKTMIQTHINESEDEVRWVRELFPKSRNYLDVYESFDLAGEKTILAHSIYTRGTELQRMADLGCHVAHCPSSNFFLGSGCFPMKKHLGFNVKFGLGTDIGAGTQFSILKELSDAYKAQQIMGNTLSSAEMLYMATQAGADALGRKDIGSFEKGKKADLVLFSWDHDPYLKERIKYCESVEEIFFVLVFFSDTSHIKAVFKEGVQVYPFKPRTDC